MTAVRLNNVSKRFAPGRLMRQPLYREVLRHAGRGTIPPSVTALDRVTLDLRLGSTVGVVGPNGAGKSTLLRIIAGIYQPTEGERTVRGRVACFFAGGAGAAPTLSVVDNVWLFSAIVGLTRNETLASLEQILETAELENDRHSRLEHLSFGMQQRLYFAVMIQAIRLATAYVYVIDEWLAGADRRYSEKSEQLMRAVPGAGRLVVFASHNTDGIRRMSDQVLYLRHGRVCMLGKTDEVLDAYLTGSSETAGTRP
jgi:ABC-type polysaccharide/polyol phosphate transport system ATPase subunit